MRLVLKRGTDQIVTLTGLRATDTQSYLNTATVKGTLLDRGQPIPALKDIPMTYVPESNGDYEWLILASQSMLQKNVEYSLVVVAQQGSLNYRTTSPVTVED